MAFGIKFENGDISISNTGSLNAVLGKEKVARDFGKFASTTPEVDDSILPYVRYNPNYGLQLNIKGILDNVPRNNLLYVIGDILNTDANNFIELQRQRDNIELDEVIDYIDIGNAFSDNDPNTVNIVMKVHLMSGEVLDMTDFLQL